MNSSSTKPGGLQPVPSQGYSSDFFSGAAHGSLSSARLILGLLFEAHRPASVIDIGCGSGTWLAAAEELGVGTLVGIDGPWVDPTKLSSPNIRFLAADLESDFVPSERFDLCISVEVAEHLSEKGARRFVRNLCATSDVVLFSAAIRYQGGVMHINEQRQSYWAKLFEECGYDCHDVFRPIFWTDPRVETWYRQNAFLYIKSSHPLAAGMKQRSPAPCPLDIVHPDLYEGNLDNYRRAVEEPTLRFCWQCLGRWGRRQLRKVFRF